MHIDLILEYDDEEFYVEATYFQVLDNLGVVGSSFTDTIVKDVKISRADGSIVEPNRYFKSYVEDRLREEIERLTFTC